MRNVIQHVTRKLSLLLVAGGLVAALALAGCAQSPATGRNIFTGGLSPEDEVKLGREQHPEIVREFGGEYDDPQLRAYVESLGRLLAQTSELPNLDWHFTVLDTPVVNAFALPGGYVYVTRGLLALADNEAELAGVLAHEIGHVTARHSAERYGQSVLGSAAALGGSAAALGVGVLLGSQAAAEATSGAAQLAVLSYSRDQEFEADTLGVRYLARTGHDPEAMATFLRRLLGHSRYEAELSSGRSSRPAGAGLPTPSSTATSISTRSTAWSSATARPRVSCAAGASCTRTSASLSRSRRASSLPTRPNGCSPRTPTAPLSNSTRREPRAVGP
jgi:predicted Zn-dependent protease